MAEVSFRPSGAEVEHGLDSRKEGSVSARCLSSEAATCGQLGLEPIVSAANVARMEVLP